MAEPADTAISQSSDAKGAIFVPDKTAAEILQKVAALSAVTSMARHWPMAGFDTQKVPKISEDLEAEWVSIMAEKGVDSPDFGLVNLTCEEIAVIVPFQDKILRRADRNLASLIKGEMAQAIARKLDKTFMGYATTPFATSVSAAVPAAHTVAYGTNVDIVEDLNQAMAAVEADGFVPTGFVAPIIAKSILRGLRDKNDRPLFIESLKAGDVDILLGMPIKFTTNNTGAGLSPALPEILVADWRTVLIGDQEGVRYDQTDKATININGTQVNLWQRNMTAIKVYLDIAFNVSFVNGLAKVTGIS